MSSNNKIKLRSPYLSLNFDDCMSTPKRRISWSPKICTSIVEEICDSAFGTPEMNRKSLELNDSFCTNFELSPLLKENEDDFAWSNGWDSEFTNNTPKSISQLLEKPLVNSESKTEKRSKIATKKPINVLDTNNDTPRRKSKEKKAFSLIGRRKPSVLIDKFNRGYSESEKISIMNAVQISSEDPDLIGDFTRPHALPLIAGKHEDMKSISIETMRRVLNGDFHSRVKEFIVIDCRFPYEYQGGHIRGAVNIHSKDSLEQNFLRPLQMDSKCVVLIFHCEFSSNRGPSMYRFLRGKDREVNEYPNLHYPEIYVLDGGYKAFFERCEELCEPKSYKPMLHADHREELKFFRTESKMLIKEKSKIGFRRCSKTQDVVASVDEVSVVDDSTRLKSLFNWSVFVFKFFLCFCKK
uniref:M-phase inducer phosphatase n=1 Tax=Strigamia maritima TaxID=126957 RepID=T1ISL8_STRMM